MQTYQLFNSKFTNPSPRYKPSDLNTIEENLNSRFNIEDLNKDSNLSEHLQYSPFFHEVSGTDMVSKRKKSRSIFPGQQLLIVAKKFTNIKHGDLVLVEIENNKFIVREFQNKQTKHFLRAYNSRATSYAIHGEYCNLIDIRLNRKQKIARIVGIAHGIYTPTDT